MKKYKVMWIGRNTLILCIGRKVKFVKLLCSIIYYYGGGYGAMLNQFFLKPFKRKQQAITALKVFSRSTMAMDMLLLLKLKMKLMITSSSNPHFVIHVVLLFLFLLKIPLAIQMRGSFTDMYFSMRLFLFRLNRVLFPDTPGRNGRRWERALRLFRERLAQRTASNATANEESLLEVSMLTL